MEPLIHNRHKLLSSLGVRQWYGKYTLAIAPITPLELFVVDSISQNDSSGVLVSSADSLEDEPPLEVQSLNVVMADLTDEVSEELAPSLKSPEASSSSTIAVELSLSVFSFEGLLVFCESDRDISEVAHSEYALLLAVVRSVYPHIDCSVEFGNADSFVWPPFLSESLLGSQSLHFEFNFKRWLGSQSLSGIKQILYFGRSFSLVEKIILELRAESDSDFIMLPIELSLSELLGAPIKKKNLWALLSRVGLLDD